VAAIIANCTRLIARWRQLSVMTRIVTAINFPGKTIAGEDWHATYTEVCGA
jgi:hypothetical protein